jgi:hypothetical protein
MSYVGKENEIEALVKRADLDGLFEIGSYSIEIEPATGFSLMPDMYFYLGKLIDQVALEERARCAAACEAIATDRHAQYKGRAPHAANNPARADTYTEGQSDGADACAAAIRALL